MDRDSVAVPTKMGGALERKLGTRLGSFAIIALGLAVFVATRRFHPVQGLGNADIGGILYSADILNHGLLPYRDTVDLKPPGSFFLVAAVFRFGGRSLSILQMAYAGWLLLGAPAIFVAARSLYGVTPRGLLASSIAVALYLLSMGLFDMNYASWMAPVYAWSFAAMIVGIRGNKKVAHLLAGVFAIWAYLLKTHAVVLAPLFVLVWLWGKRDREPGARASTFAWWIGGALLGATPIVIFYAAHGATRNLMGGIFPFESALRYSTRHNYSLADLNLLWFVPRLQIVCFALEVTLAVATVLGARGRPRSELEPLAPQVLFYLASLFGCALGGFRFYIHYMPQCLPALALLAAHPASWDWLARARSPWKTFSGVLARAHVVLIVGVVAFALGRIPFGMATAIDNRGSVASEKVGQFIAENSTADQRILVWGWQSWGVYYFADRRSPSPIFKMLGEVTDMNDSTAVSPTTPLHFRAGPLADRLMRDIRATPPEFIVRATPFFPGSSTDPFDEFPALKTMLDEEYTQVVELDDLKVYQRIVPTT